MPDMAIAALLNRLGRRTGKGNSWKESNDRSFRNKRGIPVYRESERRARNEMTLSEAAAALQINPQKARRLIKNDPDVTSVELCECFPLRPVWPAPDFCDLEFRLLLRDAHEELFEPSSLLGLVSALVADPGQDFPCARTSSQVETHLWCWHRRGNLRSGVRCLRILLSAGSDPSPWCRGRHETCVHFPAGRLVVRATRD